jgi:hypothetical protein
MNLPTHLYWGVDVAIKKLRPGAIFALSNNNFIEWQDPNGLQSPTWEEILDQVKKDQLAAEKWLEQNKE